MPKEASASTTGVAAFRLALWWPPLPVIDYCMRGLGSFLGLGRGIRTVRAHEPTPLSHGHRTSTTYSSLVTVLLRCSPARCARILTWSVVA